MNINSTSRQKAFFIHLAISVAVLTVLLAVTFWVWFPYDLIYAGGLSGLKIIIGIDLVVGPLITLIVFKPGKKGLKFDMTILAITQTCFLAYGTWLLYSQRPVVEVLANDGVYLISHSDAKHYNLKLSEIPGKYPKKVMLSLPEDVSLWGTLAFTSELVENKPFEFRQELYVPLNGVAETDYLYRVGVITSKIKSKKFSSLKTTGDCQWVPIRSVNTRGYACLSQSKGITELSNKKFKLF